MRTVVRLYLGWRLIRLLRPKLATSHLPASLRQLETAVKRAHNERDRQTHRTRAAACRASRAEAAADETATAATQDAATDASTDVDVEVHEVEGADEAEQSRHL